MAAGSLTTVMHIRNARRAVQTAPTAIEVTFETSPESWQPRLLLPSRVNGLRRSGCRGDPRRRQLVGGVHRASTKSLERCVEAVVAHRTGGEPRHGAIRCFLTPWKQRDQQLRSPRGHVALWISPLRADRLHGVRRDWSRQHPPVSPPRRETRSQRCLRERIISRRHLADVRCWTKGAGQEAKPLQPRRRWTCSHYARW